MTDTLDTLAARVWEHYDAHARDDLPWRATRDPYRVLVSEVMLQQTQVARVVTKYAEFLASFPTVEALAEAPLDEVFRVWRGLGYNRRALALKRAAEAIVAEHGGCVPDTAEGLVALPGIGHATAAQILAFAFDVGVPFIETNIRSVYLHEFFGDAEDVPDSAILPLVEATMDRERPREWFWALMDYGTHLKATRPNPSRRSRHHVRQGRFEGSNRQLRGRLLAALAGPGHPEGPVDAAGAGGSAVAPSRSTEDLVLEVGFPAERVADALGALQAEGFVVSDGSGWRIG
ncbi:MAG: A/G-specific adenine glycosylase [Coriobacteriia bacterium]|nr:A/G-specific adenine glycosylase [Coriobacteriia bacterium]MBN2848741.1 A/G-specific adenine glycosylase [Coriobacteriia bacterium]